MAQETAKEIILKCVNALELLPEETTTVKQLSDGRWFGRLLVNLTNEDITSGETDQIVGTLERLLKEHFAGPKVINFEDVVTGNELELTKLTLLLLYITFVSCAKLNNRLVHSPLLTSSTQLKLKYLIESIQQRGSGMSSKFLNILCQEKLENKATARCYTPVETVAPWGSPHVYSSSPKTTSGGSPLKELVQSPRFRMQRLLNAKVLEVKNLQKKIHSIDNDKQELEIKYESSQKRVSKLSDALANCQAELKEQRRLRDDLESRLSNGEDLVQQQVQRLSKELTDQRKENSSLEETVRRIMDDNDELATKNASLHNRLTLVRAEREKLEAELSSLLRAKVENDSLIDDQAAQIHEFKAQLEELQRCLLENKKSANCTIEESFESGSPMNFSSATSPPHAGSAPANTSGENMADMVIDKILIETREQLIHLQEQHASLEEQYLALQNQLEEVTGSRDQLHLKVEEITNNMNLMHGECETLRRERTTLNQHLESQEAAYCNLTMELNAVKEERSSLLKVIEMKSAEYVSLQQQIDRDVEIFIEEKTKLMKNLDEMKEKHKLLQKDLEANIETFANERAILTNKIFANEKEFEYLRAEIECLSSSLSRLEKESRMTIETATAEKDGLITCLKSKEDMVENLQKELETKQGQYEEQQMRLMCEVDERKNAENVLLEKIVKLENKHTSDKALLERDLQTLKEKLQILEQKEKMAASSYEEEKTSLCEMMKLKASEYVSSLNEKESKIALLSQEIKSLTCYNKEREETLHMLEKQNELNLAAFSEEKGSLHKQLEEKINELGQLQSELEQSKESLMKVKSEIEEKEQLLQNHKTQHLEAIKVVNQEKNLLEEMVCEKDKTVNSLEKEIQNITERLNRECEEKERKCLALQYEIEAANLSTNEERSKLLEDIKVKEEIYVTTQQDIKKALASANEKNQYLALEVEKKESLLNSLKQEMEDTLSTLGSEKEELTEKTKILEKEIIELKHDLNEALKHHDHSVEQLQHQLSKIASECAQKQAMNDELNEENQNLKKAISDSITTHNRAFAKMQQELASQIDYLNTRLSGKEQMIKDIEQQRKETVEKYGEEIIVLKGTLEENKIVIVSLEEEILNLKQVHEKRESKLLEECHENKMALETIRKEMLEEDASKTKKIEELSSALAEMTCNAASVNTAVEFISENRKHQIEELTQMIQDLNNTLKEREESNLKEMTSFSEKVAVLESEKEKLQQEMDRQDTAYCTLTAEHEAQKTALVSARQELEEILARERASTGEVIKTREEALNALKQDVEKALKVHAREKNDLLKQTQQKQAEVDKVKNEMEDHMIKCDELTSSLNRQKKEKETLLHDLQEDMERYRAKVNEEKENLIMTLQVKEDSYSNLKMEMDQKVALVKEEMNKEIAAKEDVIKNLEMEMKNAVEKYRTENVHLKELYEAKNETHSLLQEKLQESNNSIRTETDLLVQNLLTSQKELGALQKTHEIAQESYEKELKQLRKEIQEKNECICNLKDEMHVKVKESEETVKELEWNLEKVAAEAGLYKTKNDELIDKIDTLEKSVASKKAEYEIQLSKIQEEYNTSLSNLSNRLAETTAALEDLQRKKCEMIENHNADIAKLSAALSQEKQRSDSQQQNFEKDNEQSILKIQALIEERLNEKETLMAEKKELEMSSKSTIEELNKCVQEKMQDIEKLTKEFEEKQFSIKAELDKAQHCLQDKEESVKILESIKDGIILGLQNELKLAQQETKKYKTHVQELEAKLIDFETAVTAAKEETMRVGREHERSSRSLTEELRATKEKYRAETQTAVEKMKANFTTEIQKLMIQIEEQEQEVKTCKVFQHKYEVAKKKLADTLTELNEAKTSSKHYQTQMTKYKEHLSKVTDNLKKEQARNAELSERHQPLKENLKEAEVKIKRLDNEKRSLEVQLQLADTRLRDLKRQQNFENTNTFKAPETKMKKKASVSESQLLKVTVSKPSSSTDDDISGNDSTQKLFGNKSQRTGSRPKTISRAASAETVFRKPEAQTVTSNARQLSINVANLAASSSARTRKETTTISNHSSNKSLGQSVPSNMLFSCEDEEELFSNKYLLDMQVGRCNPMDDAQWKRLSELQRRNSLYPPHMRSAYPAEMQFSRLEDFEDDKLRDGCAVEDRHLLNLTEATESLALDSPAFNLRKRKSLSDSTNSEISIDSLGSKKNKRLSTSYSRPGPPTPGRKSLNRGDKENRYDPDDSLVSRSSRESKNGGATSGGSPVTTRSRSHLKNSSARVVNSPSSSLSNSSRGPWSRSKRTTLSPGGVSFLSKKGVNVTPRGKKGMTPSSLRKILSRGKSPWRKLDNDQETPKGLGDSTGSTGSSKLRIFRKPFGSRNYNVLSASQRSQESAHDLSNSLATSTGRSEVTADRLHSKR